MSNLTSLLTRPTTLGAIAIAGSGAFYVGLKYRTLMGPNTRGGTGTGSQEAPMSSSGENNKSYEVKPGREGGGV